MEYFTIYGEALSPYRTCNDDKNISRTHVLDKIKLTLLSIADYDDN